MAEKDNLGQALKLAKAGFYVFPCRGKQPAVDKGINWRDESTRNEAKIRQMWHNKEGLVAAIDLGKSGHIVIDCDVKKYDENGCHGNENFAALCEAHHFDFTKVPVVGTPSGGTHFYFRQRQGEARRNATGNLPFGIDVRGDGGYVIAPGMVMPDGGEYEYQGEIEDLFNAPVLPDWLAGVLGEDKDRREEADRPPIVPAPIATDGTHLANYGWKGINAELEILSSAPEGARNETLNKSAFKIATMVASGWVREDEVRPLIVNAARQTGLPTPEINNTVDSAFKAGKNKPRDTPDQVLQEEETEQERREISNVLYLSFKKKQRQLEGSKFYIERDDGEFVDEDSGEVVTLEEVQNEPVQEVHELEYPQGLVGDIARWIVATSRYPQPELAIGAALSIVGTAAGRQFAGPTGAATHLYMLALAETGTGKDHPQDQIKLIMEQAGLEKHLGPSEFISMSSVINFLKRKPLSLCPMDEFGGFMKRINSKKASGFEATISKILRSMWSKNFTHYTTPEWARDESITIKCPAISIYGASTPEQFYSSMQDSALEDGTLNRFLLFNGRDDIEPREPELDRWQVPSSIIERVKRVYSHDPNSLDTTWKNDFNADPAKDKKLRKLAWYPDGCEQRWNEFVSEMRAFRGKNADVKDFYVRTAEMALRIATIIAIGNSQDNVKLEDLNYGIKVAHASAGMMAQGAADYMANNKNQANGQKIKRILKKHGRKMKHSHLLRVIDNSIKGYDLEILLKKMIEAKVLEKQKIKPKRGPETLWYELKK